MRVIPLFVFAYHEINVRACSCLKQRIFCGLNKDKENLSRGHGEDRES